MGAEPRLAGRTLIGLALTGLALTGCPAEMLGVELPESGVAALSESDLQRDTRMLSEVSGEARLERLHRRLQEMRLAPAFGRRWRSGEASCGLREGRSDGPAVLIVAVDDAAGVESGAVPAAALISLAKITDLSEPAEGWLYCDVSPAGLDELLAAPPVAVGRALVIGPLGDGPFEVSQGELSQGEVTRASVAASEPGRTADSLDFRALRERVEGLHRLSRQ